MRSAAASSRSAGSSAGWRALGVALFLAYPATAHFARPATALALLATLAAYVAASLLVRHPVRWLAPVAGSTLFFVGLPDVEWLLYVPPIALNAGLGWLFGRTLARGRA